MKILSIIIHAGVQHTLADILRPLKQVEGFTFSHVEGHSRFSEEDLLLSSRDKVVGYVPRIRVDILLAAVDVDTVLNFLSEVDHLKGQGLYWVTPVEQTGRL